jgi:hypothetical protein
MLPASNRVLNGHATALNRAFQLIAPDKISDRFSKGHEVIS